MRKLLVLAVCLLASPTGIWCTNSFQYIQRDSFFHPMSGGYSTPVSKIETKEQLKGVSISARLGVTNALPWFSTWPSASSTGWYNYEIPVGVGAGIGFEYFPTSFIGLSLGFNYHMSRYSVDYQYGSPTTTDSTMENRNLLTVPLLFRFQAFHSSKKKCRVTVFYISSGIQLCLNVGDPESIAYDSSFWNMPVKAGIEWTGGKNINKLFWLLEAECAIPLDYESLYTAYDGDASTDVFVFSKTYEILLSIVYSDGIPLTPCS